MNITDALKAQETVLYAGQPGFAAKLDRNGVLRWITFSHDGMAVPFNFIVADYWELSPRNPTPEKCKCKTLKPGQAIATGENGWCAKCGDPLPEPCEACKDAAQVEWLGQRENSFGLTTSGMLAKYIRKQCICKEA